MSVFAGRAVFPATFADPHGNGRAGLTIAVYRRLTYTDGVTVLGSTRLTSATATFTSADEGKSISAENFPSGATIETYVSATEVDLSVEATAGGTGTSFIIAGRQRSADLATVYTDRLKSETTSNPYVADVDGNTFPYVDPGDYDAVTIHGVVPFSAAPDHEDVETVVAGLPAHLVDAVDAHDASAISVVPAGGLVATTVQAALAELDAEKQAVIPPGTYAKPATSGTLAARPAATIVGQRYLATDTGGGTQYESLNGTTWTTMTVGITEPVKLTTDQTATGNKRGRWLNTGPTLDLLLTGVGETDTAALEALIAALDGGQPGRIRLVAGYGYPGLFTLIRPITLDKAGWWIETDAFGGSGTGARIQWQGAAGATMLAVTSPRSGVRNLVLDANDLAATCLTYGNGEDMGYENIYAEDFTGSGVVIGNGVANNNNFRGEGILKLRGAGGSLPLVVNAQSTENVHLETVDIARANGVGGAALARCLDHLKGTVTIDEIIVDDDLLTTYAIRSAAAIGIGNLISECDQTLQLTAVQRSTGSYVLKGDLRSSAPQAGQFSMDLRASGNDETPILLGPVRINRKPGAANDPNVQVLGTTVIDAGVYFTTEDAGAVGKFAPTATGKVITLRDGPFVSQTERQASWPTSAKAVSYDRESANSSGDLAMLTSGRQSLFAVDLRKGVPITNIFFLAGDTALVTPTNGWASIYSSALAKLAVSVNDGSAWAANSWHAFSFAAPYFPTYTGRHYFGLAYTASTVPTLRGKTDSAAITGRGPATSGVDNTNAITNPASAPATAAALTGLPGKPYFYAT